MSTKTISSTDAQNNFGRILDDVIQNNTRYILKRRSSPKAIVLSLSDFQSLIHNQDDQIKLTRLISEMSPSYELGETIAKE
ncbi:MAG: type II toxin-antitoxin system Phd/YefM family antitoxin [Chloroflexota bacterium]